MSSSIRDATRDLEAGSSERAAEATARLIGPLLRRVNVTQILAQSGTAGSVSVDQIKLGDATIDRIVIQGLHASLDAGNSRLEQVRMVLRINVRVRARILWFRIDQSAEVGFPFTVGTVTIPRLDNISVNVPSATATGAHIDVRPVNALDVGPSRLTDLRVDGTFLPAVGFGLAGLDLGNVKLSDLAIPATFTERLSVGTFTPDRPLRLPNTVVSGVQLPNVSVPSVSSSGPIDIPDIQPQDLGRDIHFGPITVTVRPIINMHVEKLTINNIDASSSIQSIGLENISAPVSISGLRLGDLKLGQVTVNQITV